MGGEGLGSGPQTEKHLPQSPFTGQFFLDVDILYCLVWVLSFYGFFRYVCTLYATMFVYLERLFRHSCCLWLIRLCFLYVRKNVNFFVIKKATLQNGLDIFEKLDYLTFKKFTAMDDFFMLCFEIFSETANYIAGTVPARVVHACKALYDVFKYRYLCYSMCMCLMFLTTQHSGEPKMVVWFFLNMV